MSESIPATPATGAGDVEPSSDEIDVLSDGDGEEEGLQEGLVTDDEEEGGGEGESETDDGGTESEADGEVDENEDTDPDEEDEDIDDDEDKEDEDEDEDEDTDSSEASIPEWDELKEKYPEAAKDRGLKSVYFRHQKYNDLFPGGIPEAKEVAEKSVVFDSLDKGLAEGDPTVAFEAMNDEALGKLANKFLPALYKHKKELFAQATRTVIVDLFNNANEHATNTKNDNLRKSVRQLLTYLTGNPELPKRVETHREDPEVTAEKNRLRQERQDDFLRDQKQFFSQAETKVANRLTKSVESIIDPEDKLTDFAREAVIQKTLKDVRAKLLGNERLARRLQSMHAQAARANFDSEFTGKISSAYLQAAKKIVPSIYKKHRNAALGITTTKGKTDKTNKKVVTNKTKRTKSAGGHRGSSKRRIDTSKTTAEDVLNDKIVYRD